MGGAYGVPGHDEMAREDLPLLPSLLIQVAYAAGASVPPQRDLEGQRVGPKVEEACRVGPGK